MTAHESHPDADTRAPSADTLRMVRDAVLGVWRGPTAAAPPMDAAIDCLCADARARGLAAEDVILAMKGLLGGMPELREPTRREDAVRLQDVLVTRCIKAFYAS
jgi:hypothetical protein